jgi:hypothetical protein
VSNLIQDVCKVCGEEERLIIDKLQESSLTDGISWDIMIWKLVYYIKKQK